MINKQIQEIIFKHKGVIILDKEESTSPIKTNFLDFTVALSKLGFRLMIRDGKDIISVLRHSDEIYNFLTDFIEEKKMKDSPLFENYNKIFLNLTEDEIQEIMTLKSVLTYCNPILFNSDKKEKEKIPLDKSLTSISVLEYDNYTKITPIIVELVEDKFTSTTPFSKNDIDELETLLFQLSVDIAFNILKENFDKTDIKSNIFTYIGFLTKMTHNRGFELSDNVIPYIKTPNDLMRFLNEDKTLSEIKAPIKINRNMRKLIMQCFDKFNITHKQDIKSRSSYWKKIAHLVHPNEYTQYTNAIIIFNELYEGRLGKSFIFAVDELLKSKETFFDGIQLLSTKPTVFTRNVIRICKIITNMEDDFLMDSKTEFLKYCRDAFSKSSKKSLVALSNKIVNIGCDFQLYTIRGLNGKMYIKENPYKDMKGNLSFEYLLGDILIEAYMSLKTIYRNDDVKEDIKSVYLDPELLDYAPPMHTMGESKSRYMTPRWSKIELEKQKNSIIRAFIHWKGADIDVDLTASLWSEDGERLGICSYFELSGIKGVTHSGDVRNAPNGATEFVDIDSKVVRKKYKDARYVVVSVNSYSGQPMKNIEECFGGFEIRDKKYAGKNYSLYNGANASNVFYFENNGTTVIPFIIDLIEEKVISTDINGQSLISRGNINSDSNAIGWIIKGIKSKSIFSSIFELALIYYIEKDVKIVGRNEDADFVLNKNSIREIIRKII